MKITHVSWSNIILAKSEQSSFERTVAAILIILALILLGWGPCG